MSDEREQIEHVDGDDTAPSLVLPATEPKRSRRRKGRKTKARGNGEGTVYPEGDRWVAALSYFDGVSMRRKKRRCDTQEEAIAARDEMVRQRSKRTIARDDDLTVAAFLRSWLADKRDEVEASTHIGYDEIVRLYLLPELGHVALVGLDVATLRAFFRTLRAKGKSASRIAGIRRVLRSALSDAERDGLVDGNVAKKVEPPKQPRPAPVFFTPAEVGSIIAAGKGHRIGAFAALALGTGMRRGEIAGLKWSDVDLDARTLRIERQVQRIRHKRDAEKKIVERVGLVAKKPKSEKSAGEIPLPAFVVEALREHKWKQDADRREAEGVWKDTGYVFTTLTGGMLDPRNLLRAFYEILDDAGVKRRKLHATRHTTASTLAALNVPRVVARDMMRHTDSRTTDLYYTHTMREQLRGAADALDHLGAVKASTTG